MFDVSCSTPNCAKSHTTHFSLYTPSQIPSCYKQMDNLAALTCCRRADRMNEDSVDQVFCCSSQDHSHRALVNPNITRLVLFVMASVDVAF